MAKKRQSQPVSVLDVAAYILSNHFNNTPILAWKMHKLAYFCQIEQLGSEGMPMFYEKIMATPKGIMIKELCSLHRSQWYVGDNAKGNLNHLSLRQTDIIGKVIEKYGDKTMEELDELVQLTSPWKKLRQVAGSSSEIHAEITFDCL